MYGRCGPTVFAAVITQVPTLSRLGGDDDVCIDELYIINERATLFPSRWRSNDGRASKPSKTAATIQNDVFEMQVVWIRLAFRHCQINVI